MAKKTVDKEEVIRLVQPPTFGSSPLTFFGSILFVFLLASGVFTYFTSSWSTFYQFTLLAHNTLGIPFMIIFFYYILKHITKAFGTAKPIWALLFLSIITFILTPTGPVITQRLGIPRLDMIAFFAVPVLFIGYVFRVNKKLETPKDRIVLVFGFLTLFFVAGLSVTGPFFMLGSFCYPGGMPYIVAHQVVGLAVGAALLLHMFFQLRMMRRRKIRQVSARRRGWILLGSVAFIFVAIRVAAAFYDEPQAVNKTPEGYGFKYGNDTPFLPSRAKTSTGTLLDNRLLGRSHSCGTGGCHTEMLEQWLGSSHGIAGGPMVAALEELYAQNFGIESARLCGGCHAPVALMAGEYDETSWRPGMLTDSALHQEGVSCLACHSMTDGENIGNGSYTVAPRKFYLFELANFPYSKTLNDVMIRIKPTLHKQQLNNKFYKLPRACSPCHQQFAEPPFADATPNDLGNNVFEQWKASPYFVSEERLLKANLRPPSFRARVDRNYHDDPGHKGKTCQNCHMAFLEANLYDDFSFDHRFIGVNNPDYDYSILIKKSRRGKKQQLPDRSQELAMRVDANRADEDADAFLKQLAENMKTWHDGEIQFPPAIHYRGVRYHTRSSSPPEALLEKIKALDASGAGETK